MAQNLMEGLDLTKTTKAIFTPATLVKQLAIEQDGEKRVILLKPSASVCVTARKRPLNRQERILSVSNEGFEEIQEQLEDERATQHKQKLSGGKQAWDTILFELTNASRWSLQEVQRFWTTLKKHKDAGYDIQRLGHLNSIGYLALCEDKFSRESGWTAPLHELEIVPPCLPGEEPDQIDRVKVLNLGLLAIVHDTEKPSDQDGLTPWVVCVTGNHRLWLYMTSHRDEIQPKAPRLVIPSDPSPPCRLYPEWDDKDWRFYKECKGWVIDCGSVGLSVFEKLHIEHASKNSNPGTLLFPERY